MESDGEEAGNIFDEPENETEENENGKSTESSAGARVAPPKRIIRNPRLKFDPERLCGERGIPVLVDHFKNVKFKGKGHEKEDLDKLLAALEHWTHRLFPSMKFEDCLHQIERLGKKRPVQTCLVKIRRDMPILSSDFVRENEEDNVLRNEDLDPVPEDPFDQLISERDHALDLPSEVSPLVMEQSSLAKAVSSSPVGQVLGSKLPSKISEEQRQIMERNRLLAIERRKAKLVSLDTNESDSQTVRDQTPPTSFDSLLRSSTSDASIVPPEALPLSALAESSENIALGDRNSHDMDADDSSDRKIEKMDIYTQHAKDVMDSTLKIVENSVSISDDDVTNVMLEETLPIKHPNVGPVCKTDLVKDPDSMLNETLPIKYPNVGPGNKTDLVKDPDSMLEETLPIKCPNVGPGNRTDLVKDPDSMLGETLPIKYSNVEPGNKIDLVKDLVADASDAMLEEAVPNNNSGYDETIVLEGQKKVDQFSSNISSEEHLGLESLMDLVDDD